MLILLGPRGIVLAILFTLLVLNAIRHIRIQSSLKRLQANGAGGPELEATRNAENVAQYVTIVLISATILCSVAVPLQWDGTG